MVIMRIGKRIVKNFLSKRSAKRFVTRVRRRGYQARLGTQKFKQGTIYYVSKGKYKRK